jgi:predicted nucleotidyltransferase
MICSAIRDFLSMGRRINLRGRIVYMKETAIAKRIAAISSEFFIENGIQSLRLFGSYLHGDFTQNSDIDLLIEFESGHRVGYFDLSRIQIDLSDRLGLPVDLRTPSEISNRFRSRIVNESDLLYER